MVIGMSESLFTSVTKSGSLFSGISESTSSKGGLFSKPMPISSGGSIFDRLSSAPSTSAGSLFASPSKNLFSLPSSAPSSVASSPKANRSPPKSPGSAEVTQRRRSLKVATPSGPPGTPHREQTSSSGRRRSSASSQISRKYLRLQQAASVKTHRGSDEQEVCVMSPDATTDLMLSKVPASMNNRENIRDLLSPFGKVRRTFCNKNKATTIVHFNTTAEASKARHGIPTLPQMEGVLVLYSNRRSSRGSLPSPPTVLKRQPTLMPPPPVVLQAKVAKLDGGQRTVARSAGERLEMLQQRDELLRKSLGHTDLNKLPGTCPDMCPERERYARQEQHRLSIFEVLPGSHPSQVDHARAVKEYARSSADQPPPLPLDMRPLHVLTRTMEYLMAEVADRCEMGGPEKVTWGEWYDFLWSRTRAIRKEITQQRFCSVETAVIVEQMARFHIFAAVYLCGLPIDEFDPRINDENLTKCLQTLKELYHDLELAGASSPNEAEFRGFMILRNLNDTNLLNEVTQLAPHIRTSPAVRQAMAAYFDLSDNNYVHFFKLVQRASFLEAALLHRYFSQVRCRALQVMVRSYTPPGKAGNISLFPLVEVTNQLGFEDEPEALEFCEAFGLRHKDAFVIFSRAAFQRQTDPPSGRTRILIETKLGGRRIGVILKGGPVTQPFPLESPKSSFDAEGRFIDSTSMNLETKIQVEKKEVEEEVKEVEERQEEEEEEEDYQDFEEYDIEPEEAMKDYSKETFDEELDEDLEEELEEELEEGEIIEDEPRRGGLRSIVVQKNVEVKAPEPKIPAFITTLGAQDVVEEVLGEALEQLIPSTAADVLERQRMEAHVAAEIRDNLLLEAVRASAEREAQAAVQEEAAAQAATTKGVCDSLMATWVLSESRSIAQEVFSEAAAVHSIAMEEQGAVFGGLVAELARETAMAALAKARWAAAARRKFLARWRRALRFRQLRNDKALLTMAAGPPLEHSRRIADRLLGATRPPFPEPNEDAAEDPVLRALERKQRRLFAPFRLDDFPAPSGQRDRLLLLLGQPGVALEVAEFVLSKLDQLPFVEPWLLGRKAPCEKERAAAIICLGCVPPESHRNLPLLLVTDRLEEEAALPDAHRLLLSSAESSRPAWSESLAAALRWCIAQSARREEVPHLTLPAFLEAFLGQSFFRPLSDLAEEARLDARLPLVANRLLDLYSAALAVLEAEVPPDLSFRLLPLLRIDFFPDLAGGEPWEAGVAAVDRFMAAQHFSEQCTAHSQAAMERARKSFKELGRDWDLDQWMRPPVAVLPWERLLALWVEDRLAEVSRAMRPEVRASPEALRRCLEVAAKRCKPPAGATAAPLESAVRPALEEARKRKWNSFYESFKVDRNETVRQKKSSSDREWEELEQELQKLRSAIKEQLNDSMHTSDLFHA